jgi:hypothetical protein
VPTRLTIALFLLLVSAPKLSASGEAPTWPTAEWSHSQPEAQGMSSVGLATMLERIKSQNPGIRSVTVVRHGCVVLDGRPRTHTSTTGQVFAGCARAKIGHSTFWTCPPWRSQGHASNTATQSPS